MEPESINVIIYSPAAVLNLFNNSLSVNATKRIIQLKGIYVHGKGALYSGYFYDTFRDESSDAQITILVPPLIRNDLQPNKTITVNGFITKRIVANNGTIQIQLTVTDLVEQTQNKYSDEEVKKIELMQAKASTGFKDFHTFIKDRIINEQPFKIGVIIGKTGIIDNDIKHQLRESIGFYSLSFHRISLSSESEIITTMDELDQQGFEVIVISRGGGENLDIFNKISIAEKSITLKALFVTAIGHKNDVTLLQQVADKAFITPSEFGQFLNDTYNGTIEEAQHSKAKLVESVKIELAANYQKQIENLNEKLKGVEELKLASQTLQNEKLVVLNDQIQAYKTQISTLENKPSINWLVVIIAVLLGAVIGYLLKHF